jgi:arabinogalactan oligomer/maltooligosaccharide transport system substrate-binding protein
MHLGKIGGKARALAALLIAALASPALGDDLVLWLYHRVGERAGFDKLVAAYNAKKGAAGPHVKITTVPFDGLSDRVAATVPRNRGPDLFVFGQDRLGDWIERKVLDPLDQVVDPAMRQRFIPATVQAMTYRGKVYGLPLSYKVITLIYNKKLVSTPPKTTAELAVLAKRLTNRSAGMYGLAYLYGDYYYHAALQNGFGGRAFDAEMRPVLDLPENVKAAELLLRWIDDFLPHEDLSEARIVSLFNDGKAAMLFDGPWILGDLSKQVPYGLAQLPMVSGENQPMRPWMTVEGMYVTSTCKQKEAAYDFLRYMAEADAAKVMALDGDQLPAHQKVYLDPQLAENERLNAFYRQVRVAVAMPNTREMSAMWSPATVALGQILRRTATPAVALARARLEVTAAVAKFDPPKP